MNCEQYREAIAADPSFDGGAGHLSECADCQAYRREILALEERISRALAIDVPVLQVPDLPDVDTSKVAVLPGRRMTVPAWFALAATVVVAAFIGVRMATVDEGPASLADELLVHIDHEPNSFRVTDVPVPDERLNLVVPASVARLDHSMGLITYAQSCEIHGYDVPHLVMQGERGPVTILLMPHEKVDEPEWVTGDAVNGVILPVGNGSIAIFGERDEALDRIEKQVLESVSFST